MIRVWSSAMDGGSGMPGDILTRLIPVVRHHPWWSARAGLTLGLLDRSGVRPPMRVLDAGCGWGVTLEALEREGYSATGLDVCTGSLHQLDDERPGRELIEADLLLPWPDWIESGCFDAVLALDVIEHLDDDRGAVARLLGLLRPGGVLVVSVPAGPELFGEFDAVQGHRRRYTEAGLRAVLDGPDRVSERVASWARCLRPVAARQRRRRRGVNGEPAWRTYLRYLELPPWPVPAILRAVLTAETAATIHGWPGRGTTLVAVVRKSQEMAPGRS